MIYPIKPIGFSNSVPFEGMQKPLSIDFPDTITSGAKHRSERFFRMVLSYASALLNWIKYNVFFLFFDEKEDVTLYLRGQLEEFMDTFYKAARENPGEEEIAKFKLIYDQLDLRLRRFFMEEISAVAADVNVAQQNCLEETLRNPFHLIKNRDGLEILVFGAASLGVEKRIKGICK